MNTIEGTRLWTLSEGGHCQGVDTIERTRLRTLSEGRETGGGDRSCRETGGGARLAAVIEATNSSFLDPIGMWTLSLKCDGGHYRTVGTIAGELTLSQKYNGEHYRTVGTIAGDLTLSLGTDTIAKIQR